MTLSLFDIEAYSSPTSKPAFTHDPYWDEIVLEPGVVEESGQVSLLYDNSQEPPDPDDFSSLDDYYAAHQQWEQQYPQLAAELRQSGFIKTAPDDISLDRCVGEQTKKTAHQHTQFVEEYYVLRYRKPYYYYRYVHMSRRKQYRVYIGSVLSQKAIAIKEKVMEAIASGKSPTEIQQLIKSAKSC